MASLTPSLTDTAAIKDMDDCPRHTPGEASRFARYGDENRPEDASSALLKISDIHRRRTPDAHHGCQKSWREVWLRNRKDGVHLLTTTPTWPLSVAVTVFSIPGGV